MCQLDCLFVRWPTTAKLTVLAKIYRTGSLCEVSKVSHTDIVLSSHANSIVCCSSGSKLETILRSDWLYIAWWLWVTTVCEAQNRCLCWAFPIMFYRLPNIFRKENRYFLQYLNKFHFMIIVSNSVRSNFLNKPPNKNLISTISFALQN